MSQIYWSLVVGIMGGLSAVTQPLPNVGNAASLLSRMEARAAQLQDYTVVSEGEVNGKASRCKLYFKQPNLVRIDTSKGQVTLQPNGEVRGRLGHGLFGRISRGLRRDDPRLRDADGCPFWETTYAAALAQIRSQIRAGAAATMSETPDGFALSIRSGPTVRRYAIDAETLFFREISRSVGGQQLECNRYLEFRCNVGLESGVFVF